MRVPRQVWRQVKLRLQLARRHRRHLANDRCSGFGGRVVASDGEGRSREAELFADRDEVVAVS